MSTRVESPSIVSPVAMIIGSCVSLQLGAALAVQLFPELGPWGVTSVRLTVAALVLLAIARPAVRTWDRSQWCAVAVYGLALGGMNAFFYASIERLPLGVAVAIEFLGPLALSAALSRRASHFAWVGAALAGMALLAVDGLTGSDPLDPVGVALVLVAAALWAGYIRAGAHVSQKVPGLGALAVGLAISSVALLPFGVPAVGHLATEPSLLPLVLGTVLFASVVPYSLELLALRRLPQRVFGILLSLEPVFAALFGFVLLAQEVSPLRGAAIALVVAASIGTTAGARADARRSAESAQEPPAITSEIKL